MCYMMTLTEYIQRRGDEQAAKDFSVSRRCIESWRLGQRTPRPSKAVEIVEITNGVVSLAEIYCPSVSGDGENKHK